MRIVNWLFAISVALFISGIGFIVAGERTARAATPAAAAAATGETAPVATIKQIMIGITNPSAYVVYEAVGTKSTSKGIEEIAPQTEEEWTKVESAANRAIDKGDWVTMTHDMMDKARLAMAAARAKDKDKIVDTGGELNLTCDNCHARYSRE
jgi:hypothetical protein